MNERIKKLRKTLDLTQREFGARINVKPNTIATYEIGRNQPIDAVISLICREFNVNEEWLRTGKGEMFYSPSEDDELAEVYSAIATSNDEFIKRIIRAYWKLDDTEKAAVKKLIDGFASEMNQQQEPTQSQKVTLVPASAHTLSIEEQALAEAEKYKNEVLFPQILAEKVAQAGASSEFSEGKNGVGIST